MASYSSKNRGQNSYHGLQGRLWSCPHLSLLLHIIPTLSSSWNPALTCFFPSQGQCTCWLLRLECSILPHLITSYSFFKSQLKYHSLSNAHYQLSKFLYLSFIAFHIVIKYLCRYCINIYIIYHTVGSMKTGPPFSPPPTHTNILAATRIGYSSVLL